MTAAAALDFASALSAGLLALTLLSQQRRSLPRYAFAAGMLGFAAESLFSGLAANSAPLGAVAHWQGLAFVAMAFLPGCWLLFSVAYARGNAREFLARWQIVIAIAFIVPIALVLLCPDEIIGAVGKASSGTYLVLRLGFAGISLNLLFLLSAVLVLMNLERTFRAAVGTMRWRIKFVVLGLVVLFAARVYTSSQALLFHGGDLSLRGKRLPFPFPAPSFVHGARRRHLPARSRSVRQDRYHARGRCGFSRQSVGGAAVPCGPRRPPVV
jgi:hypothetical protein